MYSSKVSELYLDRAGPDEIESAIKKSSWSEGSLLELLEASKVFSSDHHPHDITRAFGASNSMLLHSVNLFSEKRVSSIRHFHAILSYSLELLRKGNEVRLIEGVSSDFIRVVQDLDLCYETEQGLHFVDLTSDPSLVTAKTQKLLALAYVRQHITEVKLFQSVFQVGSLLAYEQNSCLFSEDFALADKLVNDMKGLTDQEIDELVQIYADNLSPVSISRSRKFKSFFSQHRQTLVDIAAQNGPEIASTTTRLALEFESLKLEEYTLPDTRKHLMKHQFYFEPSLKASTTFDPWVRAGSINNFWCQMIHLCGKYGRSVSSDCEGYLGYQEGIVVTRMHSDGVMLDMLTIEAPNPIIDYFKYPMMADDLDWQQMETQLREFDQTSMRRTSETLCDKLISKILDDGKDSQASALIADICKGVLEGVRDTHCLNMLEFLQSIAKASGVSRKKFARIKKKGSMSKRKVVMSLESVGNMENIMLCNNVDYRSDLQNGSIVIFGESSGDHSNILCPMLNNQSKLVNVNNPILSWWSTAPLKFISFLSLLQESHWSSSSKSSILERQFSIDNLGTLLLLFCLNNSKFSQAADQTRYLVLNSTGMGNSTKKLYDKIGWYKPRRLMEHIYMNRLKKMVWVSEYLKANNCKDLLSIDTKTVLNEPHVHKLIKGTAWKLAFPHDYRYLPDESYLFNSFYLNKCLVVNRDNKVMSESLVLIKQLESRMEFLQVYHPSAVQTFHAALAQRGTKYRPSLYLQALGATLSVRMVHGSVFLSEGANDISGILTWTNVAEVMNNRGSVTYSGKSGLVQSVSKRMNQDSKCYLTILDEMSRAFDDDRQFHEHEPETTGKRENKIPSSNVTNLWHALFNILSRRLNIVAKMVHKDQIGVREIAVLNAPGRIICYYLEKIARLIRNNEHKNSDFTNVIEHAQKDDICDRMYEKSLTDDGVIYDNADCSSWGPSMMPVSLYITIASRLKNGFQTSLVKNILQLFSQKVFKLPDVLFRVFLNRQLVGDNSVVRSYEMVKNAPPNLADLSLQIIRSPEGMFQGILGCTSSVLAADCLRLSQKVLKIKQPDLVSVSSIVTSDDYARILRFEGDKIYKKTMLNVALHAQLSLDYGITRNMSKSFCSGHYWEFNSVFRCRSGIFKPDIKSRLSYVDYHHDFDLYFISATTLSQSVQFARQEGSLVGATMIMALRTYMNLQQNQNLSFYLEHRELMYRTPLELGGIIRCNVLKWSGMPAVCAMLENYGSVNGVKYALSNVINSINADPTDISMDPSGSLSMVPGLSRSRIVNLQQRASRAKRAITENLANFPEKWFLEAWYGVRGTYGSIIISCYQRESMHNENLPSHLKLTVPNAPYESKVFYIKGGDRISRQELHELMIKNSEHELHELRCLGTTIFNSEKIEEYFSLYDRTFDRLVPSSMTWVPSASRRVQVDLSIADATILREFSQVYTLHQSNMMKRIMMLSAFKQRFEKFCFHKGKFKVSLMNGDVTDNPWLMLVKSNICQNLRLSWSEVSILEHFSTFNPIFKQAKESLANLKPGGSGTVDITKRVKGEAKIIDITNLINESSRYERSEESSDLWSILYQVTTSQQFELIVDLNHYRGRSSADFNNGAYQIFERRIHSNKSRELTIKEVNGKVYSHYVLLQDMSAPRISDTTWDKYYYKNGSGVVKAHLTNYKGLMVLTTGGFPICCLGALLREEVHIYNLLTTLDNLANDEIMAIYEDTSSSLSVVLEKDNVVDLADPKGVLTDEGELSDLPDSDFDFDESYLDGLDDKSSEFDDELSDLESGGSTDSTFSLGSTFRTQRVAIRSGRAWAVNSVRMKRRGRYRQLSQIEIALPFDLGQYNYEDAEVTALEQLIMNVKSHGSEFSEWAIGCIALSFKSSALTRSLY